VVLPRLNSLLKFEIKHFRVINSVPPLQSSESDCLVYNVKFIFSNVWVLVFFDKQLGSTLEFLLRNGQLSFLDPALSLLVDLLLCAEEAVVVFIYDAVLVTH
jgi:hypothetical protein